MKVYNKIEDVVNGVEISYHITPHQQQLLALVNNGYFKGLLDALHNTLKAIDNNKISLTKEVNYYLVLTFKPIYNNIKLKKEFYEAIDVIKDICDTLQLTPFEGYLVGNIVKYIVRFNRKSNLRSDILKAIDYTKRLIQSSKPSF
jgi:hypothetical protein